MGITSPKDELFEGGEEAASRKTVSAIELDGYQFGQLGRDVCHWFFRSTQAAPRSQQGANVTESLIRRVVHDGNEPLTLQECRKFFVGDAFCWEAAQKRRCHQYDPDPGVGQALVDSTEQRYAEANVLLAEPDFDAE